MQATSRKWHQHLFPVAVLCRLYQFVPAVISIFVSGNNSLYVFSICTGNNLTISFRWQVLTNVILSAVCGKSHAPRVPTIVGGNVTSVGQWPWMASVQERKNVGVCACVHGALSLCFFVCQTSTPWCTLVLHFLYLLGAWTTRLSL